MEKTSKQASTRWWSLPAGTAFGVLVIGFTAFAFTIRQGGFGKNDVLSLVVWSLPSLFLAALVGILFKRVLRRAFAASFLSLVVGTLIGFGWVLTLYMIWGAWIALFDFPVAWCLIVGGIAAAAFASLKLPDGTARALGWMGLATLVGLLGYYFVQTRLDRRLACAETAGCYGRSKRVESMEWSFMNNGYCTEAIGKKGELEVHLLENGTSRQLLCSNEIAASLKQAAQEGKKAVDVVYLDTPYSHCLCSVNGVSPGSLAMP